MKDRLRNFSFKNLFDTLKYTLILSFVIILIIVIVVTNEYNNQNRASLIFTLDFIALAILIFMIYCRKFLNTLLKEILVIDIDLEKYRHFFDYTYRKSNGFQKSTALQESYVADGQYHFFKGDFSQSQESLRNVQPQKVIWYRRKPITFAVAYYTLLNYLHQKDFATYEVDLAKFQNLEDKNVAERVKKLSAIHDVLTGKTTSYFSQRTPEHKLDKVETAYYDGVNCLNQGNQVKAKELFQSILSENPDLFYVREAKKYLEDL